MDLSQIPPADARKILAAAHAYAKAMKVSRKHARATWGERFLGERRREIRHAGELTPALREALLAVFNKAFSSDFKESGVTWVRDDSLKGGARFIDGDQMSDASFASLSRKFQLPK